MNLAISQLGERSEISKTNQNNTSGSCQVHFPTNTSQSTDEQDTEKDSQQIPNNSVLSAMKSLSIARMGGFPNP